MSSFWGAQRRAHAISGNFGNFTEIAARHSVGSQPNRMARGSLRKKNCSESECEECLCRFTTLERAAIFHPTRMVCGSFGVLHLAAARPEVISAQVRYTVLEHSSVDHFFQISLLKRRSYYSLQVYPKKVRKANTWHRALERK